MSDALLIKSQSILYLKQSQFSCINMNHWFNQIVSFFPPSSCKSVADLGGVRPTLSPFFSFPCCFWVGTPSPPHPVGDPGFPGGETTSSQSGCANLKFCKFFVENCMKMKEFGSQGGERPCPLTPLWICQCHPNHFGNPGSATVNFTRNKH